MIPIISILNQTLKCNGKWSAKRFTALFSFVFACVLPLYALYKGDLSTEICMLSGEFLTASLVSLGISTWDKQNKVQNNFQNISNAQPTSSCAGCACCPNGSM